MSKVQNPYKLTAAEADSQPYTSLAHARYIITRYTVYSFSEILELILCQNNLIVRIIMPTKQPY